MVQVVTLDDLVREDCWLGRAKTRGCCRRIPDWLTILWSYDENSVSIFWGSFISIFIYSSIYLNCLIFGKFCPFFEVLDGIFAFCQPTFFRTPKYVKWIGFWFFFCIVRYRVISCVEPRVAPDKVGFLQLRDQLVDELDNFVLVENSLKDKRWIVLWRWFSFTPPATIMMFTRFNITLLHHAPWPQRIQSARFFCLHTYARQLA